MNWVTFTRRTDYPKLFWLRSMLDNVGIPNRINGESFHAPILQVPEARIDDAWEQLPPALDNLPDDHPKFREFTNHPGGYMGKS